MSKDPSRPSKPAVSSSESTRKEGTAVSGAAQPEVAPDPAETARYIEAFALELSSLAKRSRLDFLAYLLDMARMEAERAGGRGSQE
jgi:hypothetical protein